MCIAFFSVSLMMGTARTSSGIDNARQRRTIERIGKWRKKVKIIVLQVLLFYMAGIGSVNWLSLLILYSLPLYLSRCFAKKRRNVGVVLCDYHFFLIDLLRNLCNILRDYSAANLSAHDQTHNIPEYR